MIPRSVFVLVVLSNYRYSSLEPNSVVVLEQTKFIWRPDPMMRTVCVCL